MQIPIPYFVSRFSEALNLRRLRTTVIALLIGALCAMTLQISLSLRTAPVADSKRGGLGAGPKMLQQGVTAEQVASHHLFGNPLAGNQTATAVDSQQVHIIGIVASPEASQSWAILDIGGVQQTYSVGATLSDGEKLVDVKFDRVTLGDNGNQRTLLLDMQAADPSAHFQTLATMGFDSRSAMDDDVSMQQSFLPPSSPQEMLRTLRSQLVAGHSAKHPQVQAVKLQPNPPSQ